MRGAGFVVGVVEGMVYKVEKGRKVRGGEEGGWCVEFEAAVDGGL